MDDIEEPIFEEGEFEGVEGDPEGDFIEEYEVGPEVIGDTYEEIERRKEEMGAMSSEEQEKFVEQISFIYETLQDAGDDVCGDELRNALQNQDMESISEDCMEKVQAAARKHQYVTNDKINQQRKQLGRQEKTPEQLEIESSIRYQISVFLVLVFGAIAFYIYYMQKKFEAYPTEAKKKLSKKKMQKLMAKSKSR